MCHPRDLDSTRQADVHRQLELYARDFNLLLRSERALERRLDCAESEAERLREQSCPICSLRPPAGEGGWSGELLGAVDQQRRLSVEIERAHYETAMRLTRAVQIKSDELASHLQRISQLAVELALALDVSEPARRILAAAAPLHDIGKIGIPDTILLKPGPLDAQEWEVVRRHTLLGAEILANPASRLLEAAREIALTHHERWDGSGYPAGLKGKETPLFGRIVMLVDQYDALRSERPYKLPLDHEATCRVLLEGDGRTRPEHFDPALLSAFEAVAPRFDSIFGTTRDPSTADVWPPECWPHPRGDLLCM